MVEVLVEYDYTAKEPDELTIRKGDIIREVIKKAGGWWEGVLNDKKGMFPDNFVRVVEKDASNSVTFRNKKDTSRIQQCRVVFSYKQYNPDELNLSVGDVINIVGEEEEGWWRGVLNGREGVFPSNFVEEIKSKPGSREDLTNVNENDIKSPSLPPKPTKTLCQVKYSYKSQNEDELTLKEGDIITLISKDGQDLGWWKGELNGKIGVFPDNFVAILSDQTQPDERNHKDDRKLTKTPDLITPPKVPVTSSQRKSLEKQDQHDKTETDGLTKVTPPVPSKKPLIPIKKSPSGSGSQGRLLSGLRKKIVDVVDGASSSKSQPVLIKANEIKEDSKSEIMTTTPENAFDQVERTSLLSDVRATRAKAPGRRPPSVVFKEGEPGIVNGNTDHAPLDSLTEHLSNSRPSTVNNDQTENEVKPKVREWEKHKAPWLEEMKLNQAKRTSTSPGPEQHKLKLTPAERNSGSPEVEDQSKSAKTSPFEKNSSSPIDMSKSMSAVNNKLKTPPNELDKTPVILRSKPPQPIPSQPTARPQTIQISVAVTNLNDAQPQKTFSITHPPTTITATATPRLSPVAPSNQSNNNKTSPSAKPSIADRSPEVKVSNDVNHENITAKQYMELLQRIEKLESLVEQQHQMHKSAIEELKGKLQVETDMRRLLQAELDKVSSQYVMQV